MGKCFSSCSSSSSGLDHNGKSSDSSKHPKATLTTTEKTTAVSQPFPKGVGLPKPDISQRDTLQSHAKLNPTLNPSPDLAKMPKASFSDSKAQKLFERYKDPSADAILAEGTERFCSDLGVNPEEFIVLVLAWKFDAPTMCHFSREGFVRGCRAMHADSIQGIKSKFMDLQSEVLQRSAFKDLYRFTFGFGLDQDSGQRTLPIEIAMPLWKLVFSQRQPPILDRWCSFLLASEIRGISRDTWQMFLNFVETIGDNLSVYDDNEAWPSLFDDFVESEKMKATDSNEGTTGREAMV
ncbi:putative DCN1-like protein 3 [Apostichopus japonicus]|uniref:Defective in cullin neddylation protein n=1 Tax=Stichopus japonicus TaxID=307972 RepID=A0A2G8L181_STIJA|nr:putative DCN1-like protein 3 [Apostichopus japonicus]